MASSKKKRKRGVKPKGWGKRYPKRPAKKSPFAYMGLALPIMKFYEEQRAAREAAMEAAKEPARRKKTPRPEGFEPIREGAFAMAVRRAARLREVPGKPKLSQIRFDERGFIIAVDEETGDLYRAYIIENSVGERTLFWGLEYALEGYEEPGDFLDAYAQFDAEGQQRFGRDTHQLIFAFTKTDIEGSPPLPS